MTALNIILATLLAFAGWAANALGMFFNALFVFLLLMVPLRIALVLWRAFRGSLEYRLWRKPFAGELRKHWVQVFNGWMFWLLAALTIELCIVPVQFTSQEYLQIRAVLWAGTVTLILLELLPAKRIQVATNLVFAAGWFFMGIQAARFYWPMPKTEGVVLSAPFRGEWLVIQGGRSTLINHHYGLSSQRHALDMERIVNGREWTGDRQKLESYAAWGETLYAPADGKIAKIVDDCADNPIGKTDDQRLAGNHIALDIGNGRFVMMAHLQKESLLVALGAVVHAGQPMAKCGNSGNTSQPHLHIQVQNQPEFLASGVETYPILFRDVTCVRSKRQRDDAPFFVRRNDRIIRE